MERDAKLLTDDLQASRPEVPLALSRAGVQGVEKAIRLRHAGEEAIDEVVIGEAFLVEELAEHIARHIAERQDALRAEVKIAAKYPLERRTPVTGLVTQEMVSIIGIAAASEA